MKRKLIAAVVKFEQFRPHLVWFDNRDFSTWIYLVGYDELSVKIFKTVYERLKLFRTRFIGVLYQELKLEIRAQLGELPQNL